MRESDSSNVNVIRRQSIANVIPHTTVFMHSSKIMTANMAAVGHCRSNDVAVTPCLGSFPNADSLY